MGEDRARFADLRFRSPIALLERFDQEGGDGAGKIHGKCRVAAAEVVSRATLPVRVATAVAKAAETFYGARTAGGTDFDSPPPLWDTGRSRYVKVRTLEEAQVAEMTAWIEQARVSGWKYC